METLTHKQILSLKVESESGEEVGMVVGFSVDLDSQSIITYTVKPKQIFDGLFKGTILIFRDQVIEVTQKKIIVHNLVVSEKEKKTARVPATV